MKSIASALLILSALWTGVASAASPLMFEKGLHYEEIREKPSKTLELTEYFSLYCAHCFYNEALFNTLKSKLSSDVSFNRSHVIFLPQHKPKWAKNMTFAFATAKKLNIEEQFVANVFASHFERKLLLGEVNELRDIFNANGVSSKQFEQTISNQATLDSVKKMLKSAQQDQVRFTPDLIVNNKYRVLLASMRGLKSPEQELIKLVKFLLTNP